MEVWEGQTMLCSSVSSPDRHLRTRHQNTMTQETRNQTDPLHRKPETRPTPYTLTQETRLTPYTLTQETRLTPYTLTQETRLTPYTLTQETGTKTDPL